MSIRSRRIKAIWWRPGSGTWLNEQMNDGDDGEVDFVVESALSALEPFGPDYPEPAQFLEGLDWFVAVHWRTFQVQVTQIEGNVTQVPTVGATGTALLCISLMSCGVLALRRCCF